MVVGDVRDALIAVHPESEAVVPRQCRAHLAESRNALDYYGRDAGAVPPESARRAGHGA